MLVTLMLMPLTSLLSQWPEQSDGLTAWLTGKEVKIPWSGLPFPSPGHLLDSGMEARSPALQADPLASQPPGKPLKAYTSRESIAFTELYVH